MQESLLKKRPQYRYFSLHFAKFLRTLFFHRTLPVAVNVLWIKHSELKIGPSGVFIGNFEPARSIIQHINLRILFIKEEKKKNFFELPSQ